MESLSSFHIQYNEIDLSQDNNIMKINDVYILFLDHKLGSGSFGSVYLGMNTQTKSLYAIKIESNTTSMPKLDYESKILQELRGEIGFTKIYFNGIVLQDTVMVIDLLGDNLDALIMKTKQKKFSLKTTLMIADQILTRLQYLHSKGIIHRDLKPANICLGPTGKDKTLYLIDFGLARHIFNAKTNEHITYKEQRQIVGTIRYISRNMHKGIEQSRRDDLESFGYILVYFLMGSLPWEGIKSKTQNDKVEKIGLKKAEIVPEELCKFLPGEIKLYFEHVLSLKFNAVPDYILLHSYINTLMTKCGYYNDLVYDWCLKDMVEDKTMEECKIKTSTSCGSFNVEGQSPITTPIMIKKTSTNAVKPKLSLMKGKKK